MMEAAVVNGSIVGGKVVRGKVGLLSHTGGDRKRCGPSTQGEFWQSLARLQRQGRPP